MKIRSSDPNFIRRGLQLIEMPFENPKDYFSSNEKVEFGERDLNVTKGKLILVVRVILGLIIDVGMFVC